MSGIVVSVVVLAAAILVAVLASRSRRGGIRARADAVSAASAPPAPAVAPRGADTQLVAVIAAAVAAASGRSPDSFRIAGIEPSGHARGTSPYSGRGFNTPVWGHVDRFHRGE